MSHLIISYLLLLLLLFLLLLVLLLLCYTSTTVLHVLHVLCVLHVIHVIWVIYVIYLLHVIAVYCIVLRSIACSFCTSFYDSMQSICIFSFAELHIGNLKTKVRKNCRYVCLFTWVRGLAYSQGAQDLNLSSKPYLQLWLGCTIRNSHMFGICQIEWLALVWGDGESFVLVSHEKRTA